MINVTQGEISSIINVVENGEHRSRNDLIIDVYHLLYEMKNDAHRQGVEAGLNLVKNFGFNDLLLG